MNNREGLGTFVAFVFVFVFVAASFNRGGGCAGSWGFGIGFSVFGIPLSLLIGRCILYGYDAVRRQMEKRRWEEAFAHIPADMSVQIRTMVENYPQRTLWQTLSSSLALGGVLFFALMYLFYGWPALVGPWKGQYSWD